MLKQLKSKIQYPQKPRNNQWGMCLNKQNNNIFIKPNGDIIRCEHMFANTDAVIGNVRSGIKKVENNICIGCDYYKICKYGCICLSSCEGCWRSTDGNFNISESERDALYYDDLRIVCE